MTTNEHTNPEETKTKFKGPGEWRTQAKALESEDEGTEEPDEE